MVDSSGNSEAAILPRIDNIIRELEALKRAVREGIQANTNGHALPSSALGSRPEARVQRSNCLAEQHWGSSGQATVEEANEVFAYDDKNIRISVFCKDMV